MTGASTLSAAYLSDQGKEGNVVIHFVSGNSLKFTLQGVCHLYENHVFIRFAIKYGTLETLNHDKAKHCAVDWQRTTKID